MGQVAKGVGTFTATTAPTIVLDAPTSEGDTVLVVLSSTTTGTNPGDPSSGAWVNVLGAAGTDIEPEDSSFMVIAFVHEVTAGEDGEDTWTLTGTFAAGETGDYVAVAYDDVDYDQLVTDLAAGDRRGISWNQANATDHTLPAIASGDVPDTGDRVVRFSGADGTSTYTNPAGHTQIITSNTNQGCYLGTRDTATTSGVAVAAQTIVAGTSSEAIGVSLALPLVAAGEDKTTAGTITLSASASGGAAKASAAAGALSLGLAVGDDVAKAGDTDGVLALASVVDGDVVKAGDVDGALAAAFQLIGDADKLATVVGALGITLDATGTVVATSEDAVIGVIQLALTLVGVDVKAGDVNGVLAAALQLVGVTTKSAATAGVIGLALALAGAESPEPVLPPLVYRVLVNAVGLPVAIGTEVRQPLVNGTCV